LPAAQQEEIVTVTGQSQKDALRTMAFLPVAMFVFYVALIAYFAARGGYRAQDMHASATS